MEEVEWIHIDNPVFTTYIRIVQTMLEHQSNNLYVGPVLNSLKDSNILKRRMSQIKRLQVTNDYAATMFFLNMQSWKYHPFIRTNYSSTLINQLEEDLHNLTKESSSEIEIEWELRQLVFERV